MSRAALLAVLWHMALSGASASGNAIARFGGEHGTVNATNPTSLYYNPAGIGFAEGIQIFVDGQLALRSFQWEHAQGQGDAPEPAGFEGANYGTAKALNLFGGPMLGVSIPLGSLKLGAAVYAPFGGNVSFDDNARFAKTMFPGAADGVARWHAIEASTMSIYTTLGAAYRIGPLSVGVSGNLIYTTAEFLQAQNLDGTNSLMGEGRGRISVAGVNGSFGAGALLEALPGTLWIAASYQAQPGLGAMALDGKLAVGDTSGTLKQDVTLHQALPDIWRLGVRVKPLANFELRVAADWTRWSAQRTQCVALRDKPCTTTPDGDAAADSGAVMNLRRYWHDTFGARVGASVWATPALELFGGLGLESAAAPDRTLDPVLADAANLSIALGARLEVVETWFVAASYTHLQFFARDNTGKSSLANPDIAAISRRPDGGGKYTQWVGILNANVLKVF